MNGPEALLAFTIVGGTIWVLRPIGAAIAKRIAGEARPHDELLAEVQQIRQELAELAERVDFTERLLAKQREAGRLPHG